MIDAAPRLDTAEHLHIPNPDDPWGSPVYDGPIDGASRVLVAGVPFRAFLTDAEGRDHIGTWQHHDGTDPETFDCASECGCTDGPAD